MSRHRLRRDSGDSPDAGFSLECGIGRSRSSTCGDGRLLARCSCLPFEVSWVGVATIRKVGEKASRQASSPSTGGRQSQNAPGHALADECSFFCKSLGQAILGSGVFIGSSSNTEVGVSKNGLLAPSCDGAFYSWFHSHHLLVPFRRRELFFAKAWNGSHAHTFFRRRSQCSGRRRGYLARARSRC